MEKMLVVVFDNELKTAEAWERLTELDQMGTIAIYAEAIIKKDAKGKVSVTQEGDDLPIRTLTGTAIGSLIGLLGGPVGVGIGAVAGSFAGSVSDLYTAGVNAEFLDDVTAKLTPGKSAVVADISEEWISPVDLQMDELGGEVFRSPKTVVEDDQTERDVTELKAEIAEAKAERAAARAEAKAKLDARIDDLNAKLQAKLDEAKERSEQIKAETDAKVKALQEKSAKAKSDVKSTIEGRIADIKHGYEERSKRLKELVAGQLRKAAAQIEK